MWKIYLKVNKTFEISYILDFVGYLSCKDDTVNMVANFITYDTG